MPNVNTNYIYSFSFLDRKQQYRSQNLKKKNQNRLDAGFGGSELDLTRKPSPQGLAFIVLEGTKQVSMGGKQSIVLYSCDAHEVQQ